VAVPVDLIAKETAEKMRSFEDRPTVCSSTAQR
jgi:hypothetical protein